jgi:DNA-binding MarR family transcriptional regulator
MDTVNNILISLRRIVRAMDMHSKYLVKSTGLTTAQLLLMQTIHNNNNSTIGNLAEKIYLSQATVTTILDRLGSRGLIIREPSTIDKRKVYVKLTEQALTLIDSAPVPLQESFVNKVLQLDEWERTKLLSTLQQVGSMMGSETIDAAPILEIVPNIDISDDEMKRQYD